MKGCINNKMGQIQIDTDVIALYAGTTAVECFGIVGMAAYGVSISTVADNLIESVKYKVEEFTGMPVEKINIFVEGVRVID